jgi:lambda family phage portal protein
MSAPKKPGFLELLSSGIGRLVPKAWGGGFGFGGGTGYDGASSGRRMRGWNGSILGPNTITLADWLNNIRRSRDAIRNSSLASSAVQRFESNIIGTGIQPHFTHPDQDIRDSIQQAFDKWVKCADFNGQLSFYGLQSLLARELFEAGECFVRFHVVDDQEYFQLQLIETEACPVYINMMQQLGKDNTVIKEGIIFDRDTDKRVGYRIYKGLNPYDTITNPIDGTTFINVSRDEMLHVMKPLRAGALRGTPFLAPVLSDLYELEGYADSERLRKRISAMFALFVQQNTAEDNPFAGVGSDGQPTEELKLEPGTIQHLLPGESVVASEVPESGDYASFMSVELHKFAAALGITYEMLTGDYTKVNYSSARVALLEFRRQAEQFQTHVIRDQFCAPILKRWMCEAVLSGALELPDDYVSDPEQYEQCTWVPDGFDWVDPLKEVQAAQASVRGGFTSRGMVIRKNGFDPATVDSEIALERKREQELGIITDSNSNAVLIGKETQPVNVTQVDPNQQADEDEEEDTDNE